MVLRLGCTRVEPDCRLFGEALTLHRSSQLQFADGTDDFEHKKFGWEAMDGNHAHAGDYRGDEGIEEHAGFFPMLEEWFSRWVGVEDLNSLDMAG